MTYCQIITGSLVVGFSQYGSFKLGQIFYAESTKLVTIFSIMEVFPPLFKQKCIKSIFSVHFENFWLSGGLYYANIFPLFTDPLQRVIILFH